jgi:hypothetical protein
MTRKSTNNSTAKTKVFQKIPDILDFRDGTQRYHAGRNQIKADVMQVVTEELERIENPELQHLIMKEG